MPQHCGRVEIRVGAVDHVRAADIAIARAAARQHGVFTRAFALRAGLSDALIKRRLKAARYWMLWPGVYTFPEVPSTWEQIAMAGVLYADPTAALSGPAAARKLEIPGFENADIEISTTRRINTKRVSIRSRTPLSIGEVVRRDNIPATIPERTILDLSATFSDRRLEGIVDSAFHLGLTETDKLVAYLQQPDSTQTPQPVAQAARRTGRSRAGRE